MCSRFAQSNRWSKAKTFQFAKPVNETRNRYNVVYTEGATIILKPGEDYTIEDAMFWLVSPWAESLNQAFQYTTANAKSETIFELRSFRDPIFQSRCIIPSDAIFESTGKSGSRQPYALRMIDDSPFGMAGVSTIWTDPTSKEELRTFSVITVPANELFSIYHEKKRMPVILPPDSYELWLDQKLKSREEISQFFRSYDSNSMCAYPVSKQLLSRNNKLNTEECLKDISKIEKSDTLF
ncbi:SOS response-associated peptidase [Leptospira ellisii]|uniref:Abasic site processing protein n=1 Tax=Leptospira ellisii TaxID=2023197 RepID=A0A2N0BJ55_9LEPT|nr:SOS response-associated peptidase [Leptospira ellisii]MDV6237502.1 SOS response-associated peptidase [Leptospira ellisii]PJZ91376.1 DUF159 family protein [Leptospira ellisii]PKA04051.1 DUF159 family protein [Leptospira ellisii]